MKIKWLEQPEEHDYPAAQSYLGLLSARPELIVENLRNAKVVYFEAKDIFRASGLSLFGISNSHVKKDIKKIKKGIALSPLLLVRDKVSRKVVIADGYHRLCAIYTISEDISIPCKIV